jgi:uncharacterized membrane protein YccC
MLSLLVTICLCALAYWICMTLGVPQPFLKIILVVLVVIAVFAVLSAFGLGTGLSLR